MSNLVWPNAVRGLTWTVNRTFTFNTTIPKSPNQLEIAIANAPNPQWTWEFVFDYLKNDAGDIQSIYLPYTDLQTFIGFLLARQGRYDDFLFYDPSPDMNVAGPNIWQPVPVLQTGNYYPAGYVIIDPAGRKQTYSGGLSGLTLPSFGSGTTTDGTGTWTASGAFPGSSAQAIPLVSNGTTSFSPLQRYYGGQFYEDVTDLDTSVYPLTVWANGVLQTGGGVNYTLSTSTGLTGPGYSYQGLYLTWVAAPTAPITVSFNHYWRCRLASDSNSYEQFMKFLFTIGGQKTKNGSASIKIATTKPPTI